MNEKIDDGTATNKNELIGFKILSDIFFKKNQKSMHSSALEGMLFLALWKFINVVTLYLGSLWKGLLSLLFSVGWRSPVTNLPWVLSTYGELLQLRVK